MCCFGKVSCLLTAAIEVKKRTAGEVQRSYSFVSEECFESVAKSPKTAAIYETKPLLDENCDETTRTKGIKTGW